VGPVNSLVRHHPPNPILDVGNQRGTQMKFEARDLKPYIESVDRQDLVIGNEYYSIFYTDNKMLVPNVYTVVYVGKNFQSSDEDEYYFQDFDSFSAGARYSDATEDSQATFHIGDFVDSILNFEQMLDELMRCSLRRNGKEQ
jgi:hypothetical protein